MPAKKRTASPAQLRALARGRARLKASRGRKTVKPKRNPVNKLARTRALASNLKAGKQRLTNPIYHVVYDGRRYFDGAGWTVSKNHAAHYKLKKLANLIGQKVADATGKSVYVVPA